MEQNIHIIPMIAGHYDSVFKLWQNTPGLCLRPEDDSLEAVTRYLARNPGLGVVALDRQAVVGAVMCGHDARRGYLHHLAVDPDYRRRGIATALVSRCLSNLQNEGINRCHVFVLGCNSDGLAFWKSLGFCVRSDISLLTLSVSGQNTCC